ncbi:MAG TPA: VWA domain-containing protein [Thermoanaerobaculia bacterium]|jgi:VWFA-related protein|nr:VWA domain-containing protein [Thermoanaerobaculia bacterium]
MSPVFRMLVFLAAALPLAAQNPAPVPPPETFSGSIDVRVVNVEAVVTDHRGQRVSGLTAKDFHLRVDGKEMPIDSFAEVGGGKAAVAAAPAASAGPAGSAGPSEAAAPPQGRSLVVFIDESFAVKSHRDIVLKKLAIQLGQLEAADRVAVVAFDGTRMSVLCDWTDDRAVLSDIFARAQLRPANGIAAVASRRAKQDDIDLMAMVNSDLNLSGEGEGSSGAEQPVGPSLGGLVDEAMSAHLGRMPTALTAAMRAFANAPGRKLMLLLSGGWPSLSVGMPVVGEANRLGYTLYPVDVTGVDTTFLANDASYAGSSPVGHTKDAWESNSEYALEVMAKATGGKASIDSARLDALPRILEDTRSYYWMSFTPHWTGDDRSHRIQVEVSRPGLQIRSRRSFADFSQATRAKLGAEDVLFFGGDPAGKQLGVEAETPQKLSARRQRFPFVLVIPLAAFAGGREGRSVNELVLAVQTEDDSGNRTRFPDTPIHVSPEPTGGTAHFKLSLPLSTGRHRLIFTLREPASGTVIWGDKWVQP